MKKEKIWQFIKHPPKWLTVLTYSSAAIFSALSVVLLALNRAERIYSYIVFVIAALTLTYAVFLFVKITPKIKLWCVFTLKKYKFTRKVYEDYKFRTVVFSCSSLFFNFCFGAFEIVIGAVGHSIWFGSLGLYHLILSLTRFGIVYRYYKQSKTKKVDFNQTLKTYKNTGICILMFNLALTGAMGQMIFSQRAFDYGVMVITMAAYAFYKIIVSIYGIFKAKKHNDYNTQSLRNLNLTDAMVSLYALQTALIATFSIEQETDMAFMNMATGIVVTGISLFVGIYMIVKSKKEANKYTNKNTSQLRETSNKNNVI